MDGFHCLLKALVQGLAEFLPVSSTAHLIFTDTLFQFNPARFEFYDILLHMGTLAAVLAYFGPALWRQWCQKPQAFYPLLLRLGLSSAITATMILGIIKGSQWLMAKQGWQQPGVEDLSDYFLAHPLWVCLHLGITGALLWLIDRKPFSSDTDLPQADGDTLPVISLKQAVLIGFFQGLAAIFHGLSRSGSTIIGGLVGGLDRVTATRYSFLLSIPTFVMAMGYETLKLFKAQGHAHTQQFVNWAWMIPGVVLSAVVGYWVIKGFIRFVAQHPLRVFSLYCLIVASVMAGYLLI